MPILAAEPRCFPDDILNASPDDHVGRSWRVAYTRVRQEKALARNLRELDVPHYLPLVAKTHVYRARRVESFVPLFNSYVFLFCSDDERQRSLNTNRIAQFIPVRDAWRLREDLARIEQLIELDVPLTIESRLRPGQRVRVLRGSLEGLEGVVESRRRTSRLIVAIEFLQQGVSLEIDDYLLEPI